MHRTRSWGKHDSSEFKLVCFIFNMAYFGVFTNERFFPYCSKLIISFDIYVVFYGSFFHQPIINYFFIS